MKNKVLILLGTIDWLADSMKKTGIVDVAKVYHDVSPIKKMIRKLHYHTNLPKSCWYDSWKHTIQQYDTIILFDAFLGTDVADYIEQKSPYTRLIVFYFNPWFNNYYLSDRVKQHCEIWSFDKKDCETYRLKYNHQFYFFSLVNQSENKKYFSDLFFVGVDKGRLDLLMKLSNKLKESKLNVRMHIVGNRRKKYSIEEKKNLHNDYIAYEDVLKYVKNTKCLLEIVQMHQEGLTLRMMEAMFFDKKIITNNIRIVNYDFYNPRNIYILNHDQRDINKFILDEPEANWESQYISQYSFENWLNNFFDKNNI